MNNQHNKISADQVNGYVDTLKAVKNALIGRGYEYVESPGLYAGVASVYCRKTVGDADKGYTVTAVYTLNFNCSVYNLSYRLVHGNQRATTGVYGLVEDVDMNVLMNSMSHIEELHNKIIKGAI